MPADVRVDRATSLRVVELGPSTPRVVIEEWLDLAIRLGDTSYFQSPDWIVAWWNTIAQRPPTHLACWWSDGRLQALVALSRTMRRPSPRFPAGVPVLTNAGSGSGDGDHCEPLVPGHLRGECATWLSAAAGRHPLVMRSVGDEAALLLPSKRRILEATRCPRLVVDDALQPFARSSNFRRQLGRYVRRFEREGVEFEWQPPGRVDERVVDALFDLHLRRRKTLSRSTSLGSRHRALLEGLMHSATSSRGPAAVVAHAGTRVVGVLIGFRWKDTFSAYQAGWDPELAPLSLGTVLVHQAITMSVDDGARIFDFLRGSEPYKYRFGAVDRYDHTYLVPRGVAGCVLEVERQLRTRVRRFRSARQPTARTGRRAASPR